MLHDLPSYASSDLTSIFEKYSDMRSEPAKVASDSSREFADLIYEQVYTFLHFFPQRLNNDAGKENDIHFFNV